MKKRAHWRVKWWLVFRTEQKNPTWKFGGHCVVVDAVRAYTETEAQLQAADRNPCRNYQRLEVRLAGHDGTAVAVRNARQRDLRELRELLGPLNV